MRRSFHYRRRFRQQAEPPRYRINALITATEVRLIDETNTNVGVVATADALARAVSVGLDLVEVSPKGVPPVARIVSYGSLKYQEEKQKQRAKQKQKKVAIKGIRLSLAIGPHDREVRRAQAEGFLNDGDKVRLEMLLRGRQKQHTDIARGVIETFIKELGENVIVEQPMSFMAGKLTTIVAKKTQQPKQQKPGEISENSEISTVSPAATSS